MSFCCRLCELGPNLVGAKLRVAKVRLSSLVASGLEVSCRPLAVQSTASALCRWSFGRNSRNLRNDVSLHYTDAIYQYLSTNVIKRVGSFLAGTLTIFSFFIWNLLEYSGIFENESLVFTLLSGILAALSLCAVTLYSSPHSSLCSSPTNLTFSSALLFTPLHSSLCYSFCSLFAFLPTLVFILLCTFSPPCFPSAPVLSYSGWPFSSLLLSSHLFSNYSSLLFSVVFSPLSSLLSTPRILQIHHSVKFAFWNLCSCGCGQGAPPLMGNPQNHKTDDLNALPGPVKKGNRLWKATGQAKPSCFKSISAAICVERLS